MCGLSGQVWRVGQRNCRRVWSVGSSMASGSRGLSACVVCRGEKGEWVKRTVAGMWSVGTSMASGSKELSACVVCRDKFVAWVKGIVDGVWSVGTSMASESRELSTECGLSGQVWRVGQEACHWYVVCRDKYGEWVKGIVGGCGLSGQVWRVGQRNCRRSVVCRDKYGEWVKRIVAGEWSVGVKTVSESKKPHISYASNVANRHSDQNCQNPQNMIHLL